MRENLTDALRFSAYPAYINHYSHFPKQTFSKK
jgi:hypothetical protein